MVRRWAGAWVVSWAGPLGGQRVGGMAIHLAGLTVDRRAARLAAQRGAKKAAHSVASTVCWLVLSLVGLWVGHWAVVRAVPLVAPLVDCLGVRLVVSTAGQLGEQQAGSWVVQ